MTTESFANSNMPLASLLYIGETLLGIENMQWICALTVYYVILTEIRHWAYGKIPCTAATLLLATHVTGYGRKGIIEHWCVMTLLTYAITANLLALVLVYGTQTGKIRWWARVLGILRIPLCPITRDWLANKNAQDAFDTANAQQQG